MIVSDAGPLRYLVLLEEEDLIPKLLGPLIIPFEVGVELAHESAPAEVRNWIQHPPSWVTISTPGPSLVTTKQLHVGELAAMRLAERSPGSLLIVDDALARQEAVRRGLAILGTLELLFEAGISHLGDFESNLGRLLQTNFRLSHRVRQAFLARWAAHQNLR